MASHRTVSGGKLLCLDFGTSSVKGGLIGADGRLSAWTRKDLLDGKAAAPSRWDPGAWLDAFRGIASQIIGATDPRELSGIVLSGNGPTLVPLDRSGRPSFDALLWIDRREERMSGTLSFFLPKAAWVMRHVPEVYRATASFMPFPEYLNFVLTGEKRAILPSEEFAPYFWSSREQGAYGLDPGKFPAFARIGEVLGTVSTEGAEATGVPKGLPVVAGGSDFLMALIGTGTVVPGRTCDRGGTSEGINHCVERPVAGDRLRCLPHAIPGLYNVAGILPSAGRLFEWFRSLSGQRDKPYGQMLEEILAAGHDVPPPIFFPSLRSDGPWELSGGAFARLAIEHGAPDMGRAVVEALGFAVRGLVEALDRSGCRVSGLTACGGQARNPLWNQLKADITGRAVEVPEIVDAELLGAACAGLVGLGEFRSLEEASLALARTKARYLPRPAEHERYTRAYEDYLDAWRRAGGGDP